MTASYTDHPYHYKGYMYVHKPKVMLQATIHADTQTVGMSDSGYWLYIYLDTVIIDNLYDNPFMLNHVTISIGTTPGGWDLGSAVALWVQSNYIGVKAANGIGVGEITPNTGAYITVWEDPRVWSLPPIIYNGILDRDPFIEPIDTADSYVLKCGAGYAGFEDPSLGYKSISIDPSESYRVSDGSQPTEYNWTADFTGDAGFSGSGVLDPVSIYPGFHLVNLFAYDTNPLKFDTRHIPVFVATDDLSEADYTGGTAAASTGTAANAFDNDTATFWVPSALPGYVTMEFLHKTKVAGYSLTAANVFAGGGITTVETSTAALRQIGKVFSTSYWEAQSFIPSTGPLQEFSVKHGANTGSPSGTITWQLRSNNAGNPGTVLQTGTYTPTESTTNTITVSDGITLSATTYWLVLKPTNTQSSHTHWQIYASNSDTYADGQAKVSSNSGASWSSEGRDLSITITTTVTDDFPTAWTISGYNALTSTYELLDSRSGETFTIGQTRTFTLDDTLVTPFAYYSKYRLNITASGSQARVAEWNLLCPDDTIRNFEVVSHQTDMDGQRYGFKINEPFDLSEYPDGTLVMYWEREFYNGVEGSLSGPTGREHVKFIGWIDTESHSTQAEQYDTNTGVTIECIDVGKRLQQIAAFPFILERDAAPADWGQQANLNIDRYIWYILRWTTTALSVADFTWSNTLDTYGVTLLSAQGNTPYEQVDYCARAMGARLTCDKFGRLWVKRDPQLLTSTAISLVTETNGSATRDAWIALSGPATAKTKLSQSFKVETPDDINKLALHLLKTGSPTGTATMRVETDSGGDASGTLAHANATATFAESGVSGTGADQIVTFATAWTPAANTTYHIVLSTSRSPDASNYISWGADGSAPGYANGEMKSYTASWAAETKDACFEVYQYVVPARDETLALTLTEADYVSMTHSRTPNPRTHWLWGNALTASTKDADDGTWTPESVFCVAPGSAPGQGAQSADQSEQVVVSQDELNARMGQQYSLRLNATESMRTIVLAHAGDYVLDPAAMQYIGVTVTDAHANERGETLSAEPMLLQSVRIDHDHQAQTKTVTIEVERAVDGVSAQTYTPPS